MDGGVGFDGFCVWVRVVVVDGAGVTELSLAVIVTTPALFELVTLVGYYSLLAVQLRVFRVDAPSADA